jgi:hypothetical protein
MYMNQLTIIGFTGQDAELHYTQNGTPVTTLSVATKESWKNDQGEWQSRTEWHRVVAFGKLAEYARTLPKGSPYGQETRRIPYRPGIWTAFLRATTLRGFGDYRDPQS